MINTLAVLEAHSCDASCFSIWSLTGGGANLFTFFLSAIKKNLLAMSQARETSILAEQHKLRRKKKDRNHLTQDSIF